MLDLLGSSFPPFEYCLAPWGLFVQDGFYVGLTSPIDWLVIVNGTFRRTIERREITIQAMRARDGTPYSGAEIRLVPRVHEALFPKLTVEASANNLERAQAKFRVLDGTNWSASVRIPGSENWIPYTITLNEGDDVRVAIDAERTICILARNSFGAAAAGVELGLTAPGRAPLKVKTDEEGWAEVEAEADILYLVEVTDYEWKGARVEDLNCKVKAGSKVHELTLARVLELGFTYSAVGFAKPARIAIALFGTPTGEFLTYAEVSAMQSRMRITDAVTRIAVIEPGCLYEELPINPTASTAGPPVHLELKRGPTVSVDRALLPKEYPEPLKASAKALTIAKYPMPDNHYLREALKKCSSEFAPSAGDIVFGPFTPGTYELKIRDASGKTLWKETREVK
jgi:hypothetical protein